MANVIIVHGTYGYPEENWFPWLKEELEKLGQTVFVPKFPTPEGNNLENWLKVFENYEKYLDEDSIVVGHSQGVPFLLNVLERSDKPIKATFLVAGFTGLVGLPQFDPLNKTISDREFNWEKIKQNSGNFYLYHSDNDPYVSVELGLELAKNLGVESKLVKNAGHFNTKSGYDEFEILLEDIKKIL